jgi:hypothetical protein
LYKLIGLNQDNYKIFSNGLTVTYSNKSAKINFSDLIIKNDKTVGFYLPDILSAATSLNGSFKLSVPLETRLYNRN